MKKAFKVIMVVILVVVLLIAGVIFWVFHSLKTELGDHWKDYANAFTLQTEVSKDLPPLDNIEQYTVAIAAINNIDLCKTIIEKDTKAAIKYNHAINLKAFMEK